MKNKKGFLDISFSWIFAFLIGAMILVGAVYGVNKFSSVKNIENSAELGTALKNLLTPLETGVESTKSISITLPVESRITHKCDTFGNFGEETFSVEEKVKTQWTKSGVDISFQDKYIFLPKTLQGKTFNIFSKSFDFPFKVSNLIYFSNSETVYCFVGFSKSTKTELQNLNQPNFEFDTCPSNSTRVCLDSTMNCEIKVNTNENSVTKNGEKVYFEEDALMYAAIFSDKVTYECEVKRLMQRATELSEIYEIKSLNLLSVGCDSSLKTELISFGNTLSGLKDSGDLFLINKEAKRINNLNFGCELW